MTYKSVDKAFQFIGGYRVAKDDWSEGAWLAVLQDGNLDFTNPNGDMVLSIEPEVAKDLFIKLLGMLSD